ncbi:hypothetical protein [Neorhizobium galegae]|uniref:hypothetical protein n=1 Tax=Neorhizobium galegae TaxID=399 RepID=UPI00127EB3D7|nr:hypothetical protein [Neorhizobium galegae]KAA9387065.1 hypothetical protein F4V88_11615 [Neorhizobium galegae]KAB1116178.1 hypothetical protein F4V89_02485 [Neorhizobium galegae]MCM2500056.1 hypothetical protein [Neorhizobium galegae]MCQ1771402.1 hypothetical protein [Neorhizobium galegae]
MPYEKPPIETYLAARTAEMLALPHMACRRRSCRRRNACYWHFKSNNEPCCLQNLDAAQRQVFDAVYDEARGARDHLGRNGLMFASRRPGLRALEDAGVEIARTAVSKTDRKRWNAYRRKREKLPPPEGE